uniref:Neprosin activation peptide domain-containing protein n=1 Tax=Cajanus cajan TaxID=3821 RepID=A0A151UED3_CAJCA
MINTLLLVLCLLNSGASHSVHRIQNIKKEDLELKGQLKHINKDYVKTIHTKFGDIVDCIDIHKQPAFDHPLLKNHKLQRKPSFQNSIKDINVEKLPSTPIFGLENDPCPTGSVPILRTKDELIQNNSLLNNHIMTQDIRWTHKAELSTLSSLGPYYGVGGRNNIYKPKVNKDQISASHLWVRNGGNMIRVGWHVAPQLYGNDEIYFYSLWTVRKCYIFFVLLIKEPKV